MKYSSNYDDDFCVLADKAYLELQDKGRESLALNRYLYQMKNPQVAFGVKQQCPRTVVEVVRATIELESYLSKNDDGVAHVPIQSVEELAVASIRANQQSLIGMIGKLVDHIEQLVKQDKSRRQEKRSTAKRDCQTTGNQLFVTSVDNQDIMQGAVRVGQRIDCQQDLELHYPMRYVPESDSNVTSHNAPTPTINNVSNYSMNVDMGSVLVSFLVDTGAAVSPICSNIIIME